MAELCVFEDKCAIYSVVRRNDTPWFWVAATIAPPTFFVTPIPSDIWK